MTKELEIEFKNLLTEQEYRKLLEQFGYTTADARTQTNHYFDTADFRLRARNSALRIRQKGAAYECTLKIPAENGYYEITDPLNLQQAENAIDGHGFESPEVSAALTEIGISFEKLVLLGNLTTHRIEFPYKNGLLVLDHSEYHGTEDFEVEYEVQEFLEGEENFEALLAECKIPLRPTDKKIARFMKASDKR